MNRVDAGRLRELLDYDPVTGSFRWRVERRTGNGRNRANVNAGALAGGIAANGYRYIGIDGRRYQASHLAWLWMTGDWPEDEVDHWDGESTNDCWGNLRAATSGLNGANTRRRSDNTSGFKGVSWDRNRKKWAAKIQVNGRSRYLGRFAEAEEAHAAYVAAAEKYYGEYARVA